MTIDSYMLSISDTPSSEAQNLSCHMHSGRYQSLTGCLATLLYKVFMDQLSRNISVSSRPNATGKQPRNGCDSGHPQDGGDSTQVANGEAPNVSSVSRESAISSSEAPASQPLKRTRESDSNEDDTPDGRRPRRTKVQLGELLNSPKLLACPFWKLDCQKHRKCFKSELHTVSRVKQHLSRRHRPTFYCDRCMVIFPDKTSHNRHLTQVCILDPNASLDGISHLQQWELSRRSNRSLSEQEQWFAIWDILFPNQTRPMSAYMDHRLSEAICQFHEFTQRQGRVIATRDLQKSGVLRDISTSDSKNHQSSNDTASAVTEAVVQCALGRALDLIFEDWLADAPVEALQRSELSSTEPNGLEVPNLVASSSSVADSSVTLVNNHTQLTQPEQPARSPHVAPLQDDAPVFLDAKGLLSEGALVVASNASLSQGFPEPTMINHTQPLDNTRAWEKDTNVTLDIDRHLLDIGVPIMGELALGTHVNRSPDWKGSTGSWEHTDMLNTAPCDEAGMGLFFDIQAFSNQQLF